MKNYRILLYVAGILIIGACGYMFYDKFTNTSVFWLDLLVVLFIYIINIRGAKGLFFSTTRFGKGISTYGIILTSQLIYSLLSIAGILAGYFMKIEPGWQFIYQAIFVLFLCFGGYTALYAAKRQQIAETAEQQNKQPLSKLKEKAEILRYKTSLSEQLSTTHKRQINTLIERIGMISPNTSTAAVFIESELSGNLDELTRLLSAATINVVSIEQALASIESQIGERMKLVTT